jgi:hypothetical protein
VVCGLARGLAERHLGPNGIEESSEAPIVRLGLREAVYDDILIIVNIE